MFTGFTDETVQFFLDLRFHNYTDFFRQHHDRYVEVVQKPFYELIDDLSSTIRQIDPLSEIRPYKCLSRIHRDTRFSRDKSPYRDHLWFLFRREGEPREKSIFFFGEFGPERLDWGLGIWGENREVMDIFRKKMFACPEGILSMIDDMDLPGRHLSLGGTSFKRLSIPPQIPDRLRPWYSSKEMYIGKVMPEYGWAFSNRLSIEMKKDFLAMAPMYSMLRGIMDQVVSSTNR